jgi:hypothetical protein
VLGGTCKEENRGATGPTADARDGVKISQKKEYMRVMRRELQVRRTAEVNLATLQAARTAGEKLLEGKKLHPDGATVHNSMPSVGHISMLSEKLLAPFAILPLHASQFHLPRGEARHRRTHAAR